MAFYYWQQRQDDIDRSLVMKDIVLFCDEDAIEDEINFLCTCIFYSEFRDTLFHNINSIEPTVVNISAMSGIDLLTFLLNDKFVKYVADFISNAWYKRQHALFN